MWNIMFIFTMFMETGVTVVPVDRPEFFATKALCEATRAQVHGPIVQAVSAGEEEHGFVLMSVESTCVNRGAPA